MSSPEAASRAAAPDLAASLAALLSPARAAASRKNGARSRGPKTQEGKQRSARNALRHGLRAERFTVVGDEDPRAFAALEAALVGELAPEGALQNVLAARIARAAWRLERAERIEAELFAHEMHSPFGEGDLGLALIRDGNGARAFNTLLRYRAAAQAELMRSLRLLKGLQAEAAQADAAQAKAPTVTANMPIEPEARSNSGGTPHGSRPAPAAGRPVSERDADAPTADPTQAKHPPARHEPACRRDPKEPEGRRNPAQAPCANGPLPPAEPCPA